MIKGWPDHQSSGGGNLTQFAIVLSNYAKIRSKVKSVMFIISDINYKVIYLLLLLYYYELIINMNSFNLVEN